MRRNLLSGLSIALLVISIVAAPGIGRAQQTAEGDGFSILGSVLLSILHVPLKLVTCVGTQVGAGVAYVATYGVEGNYSGGTNGKEIGEVASRSCTGEWIIPPQQVKKDYE